VREAEERAKAEAEAQKSSATNRRAEREEELRETLERSKREAEKTREEREKAMNEKAELNSGLKSALEEKEYAERLVAELTSTVKKLRSRVSKLTEERDSMRYGFKMQKALKGLFSCSHWSVCSLDGADISGTML
jgi:DNA repair exonuclease SbcCD ATPase subunit